MKKLLALLLAIVMILNLAACGNKDEDDEDDDKKTVKTEEIKSAEDLIGTWTMRVSLDVMRADMEGYNKLKEEGFDFDYMEYEVTFDENGKMTFDAKSMQEAQFAMQEELLKWIKKGDNIYVYYEAMMGMEKEQVDSQFRAQGITAEDALEQMETNLKVQKQYADQNAEDLVENYVYEDGKLYTWSEHGEKNDENYMTIGKSGKKLIILEYRTAD